MKNFVRFAGFSNIVYGTGFLLFWMLYGLLLPISEFKYSIVPLVADQRWIWINTIGIVSSMFGFIGLAGMFYLQLAQDRLLALIGFVLTVFGMIMGTGQLMWEATLFKILVNVNPGLLAFDGPVYTNSFMIVIMISGALSFSIGYFIFAFACRNCNCLPSWGLQFIIIGAPLFGLAPLFGPLQHVFRLTGVAILACGLVMTGYRMYHQSEG